MMTQPWREAWIPHGSADDNRLQANEQPEYSSFDRPHGGGWWPPEHSLLAGNVDVNSGPSVDAVTRKLLYTDDRNFLDKTEIEQREIREAMAEWRLRDGRDPDCAEFERLRTPTHCVVEHGKSRPKLSYIYHYYISLLK